MNLHDFYYDLPQELIAQDPLEDRSSSRLMHMDRQSGVVDHKIFSDVIDFLEPGDCLVINNMKTAKISTYTIWKRQTARILTKCISRAT